MRKTISILLAVILISVLTAGCTPKQKPSPAPQSTSAPAAESKQDAPVPKEKTKAEEPTEKSGAKEPEVIEATGIYNGQVDPNFIEIKLDNAGSPVEFSIQELQNKFEGFTKNDRVKIAYIINEEKQFVLKSIEKIK